MSFEQLHFAKADVKNDLSVQFHKELPGLSEGPALKFDSKDGNAALVATGTLPAFELHDSGKSASGASAGNEVWATFEGSKLVTEQSGQPTTDAPAVGSNSAWGALEGANMISELPPAPVVAPTAASSVWGELEGATMITEQPAMPAF